MRGRRRARRPELHDQHLPALRRDARSEGALRRLQSLELRRGLIHERHADDLVLLGVWLELDDSEPIRMVPLEGDADARAGMMPPHDPDDVRRRRHRVAVESLDEIAGDQTGLLRW